uniref:Innexin n=1 Tax=Panagrellus redivivus TaxID=6233 RepID=A0A7E4UNG9_PANRE
MNVVQGLLSAVSPLPDGDFVDRLNYCYTTTALIVSSAFISGWSFVGQPIQCWFPAYYRGWWMEYALDYCYVQNTYFVAFTEVKPDNFFDIASHIIPIPQNVTERDEKQIGYYQWVPFVLALQALLFYLPVVLWRSVYNAVGFKVRAICETCSIKSNMDPADRAKNISVVARFLIFDHDVTATLGSKIKAKLEGQLVVTTYLLVKFLYALNAVFQFLIVKWMLGNDSLFWGWNVLQDLIAGKEWPQSGNFPRVTMCDFAVRVLGNLHRHSVQCVLMINMFNEKIFVMLWFVFFALAIASFYSLISWALASASHSADVELISNYLAKIDPEFVNRPGRKHQIRDFIKHTLRPDGVFLVRLIATNSGDLVTCDLIAALWKEYIASGRTAVPPYLEEAPLLGKKGYEK